MRFKGHTELYDSPFLNEKNHNKFQRIIGVCQWVIVAGIFYLSYSVSSLIRFSAVHRVGRIDLDIIIFGYLKNYPERGYAIKLQPLTIDANYEKVHMKYDFVNQYAYFSEYIDDQFSEPLLDSLDIHVFVDIGYGHNKVTGISITGLFLVLGSTPTTWSSKLQIVVQT